MLLPLQGVNAMAICNPGCRFACPGLGAFGLSARALSAAPQQFKQAWLYSVCTIIQGVHYWMQNHAENIMNFEHSTN